MNRRSAISAGAAGLLGLNLLGYVQARAEGRAAALPGSLSPLRSCIVIFYYGGPSQLETWDPKADAPAEVRGDFKPIATSVPGVRISEHLPMMARRMQHVALIRSMTHGNRLHDSAAMESLTGRRPPQGDRELDAPAPQVFPSWGGIVNYMLRERRLAVGHVALPFVFHNVVDVPCQGAGFLGPAFDPFRVDVDPVTQTYRADALASDAMPPHRRGERRQLLDSIDAWARSPSGTRMRGHFDRAFTLLEADAIREALDLSQEDPRQRERYGSPDGPWEPGPSAHSKYGYARNMRGQNLLLARRLVEAGVPFVNVYDYKQQGQNWDTHADNFGQHRDLLLPPLDRSVSALIDDLEGRGLLDSTLIVGLGEFGRTPRINAAAGRDHWPDCYSVFLAGGGVRGGYVHGASDRLAAYPAADPVTPADLAATLFWRFGLDPASEIRDTQGRPYPLSTGTPVTQLFG
jgi:hypothetical protein